MKPDRMKLKVYIAGPISGAEDFNRGAFDDAAMLLRAAGHEPVNPLDLNGVNEPDFRPSPYRDYIKVDIAALLECDAIFLLPGWQDSTGASTEFMVACALGLHVMGNEGARFGTLKALSIAAISPHTTPLVLPAGGSLDSMMSTHVHGERSSLDILI